MFLNLIFLLALATNVTLSKKVSLGTNSVNLNVLNQLARFKKMVCLKAGVSTSKALEGPISWEKCSAGRRSGEKKWLCGPHKHCWWATCGTRAACLRPLSISVLHSTLSKDKGSYQILQNREQDATGSHIGSYLSCSCCSYTHYHDDCPRRQSLKKINTALPKMGSPG
jgi:hypothetical protein